MLTSNNNKIKKYCRIYDQKLGSFIDDIFIDQQIIKTNNKEDCDLFIPKTEDELDLTEFSQNTIFGTIDNINHLNKKSLLWTNLVDKWGRKNASNIIPQSFNILHKLQLKQFAQDFLFNKTHYILKNEQESARGILVSNDIKQIIQHILSKKSQGYPVTIIQKIIKSLLIDKHVFKIRMFLLIKCDRNTGKKHFYLHQTGSIFYAPEKYSNNVKNNNNIIANGYWYKNISHTDYVGFINDKPKTLADLINYLENIKVNTRRLFTKLIHLLILIFKAVEHKIYTKHYNHDQFCILGFDVMIDENFKPWVIEFNKGPSLSSYDDVDVYNSKKIVWNDMYNLVNNVNSLNNRFKQIYQV